MAEHHEHKDYPYICRCNNCGHRFVLMGLEDHPIPAPVMATALVEATEKEGCRECGALRFDIVFDRSDEAKAWYDEHVRELRETGGDLLQAGQERQRVYHG